MKAVRKKRLLKITLMMLGIGIALSFILYALRQNIDFFFSPSEVMAGKAPKHHLFHLGGLVAFNSIHYGKKNNTIYFSVTDKVNSIPVEFHGVLPTLFKAGRSVVVLGHLQTNHEFVAVEVLAKHDNRYMPRQVKDALQHAKYYPHYQHMREINAT